jgi:hypothetical protein
MSLKCCVHSPASLDASLNLNTMGPAGNHGNDVPPVVLIRLLDSAQDGSNNIRAT